MNGFWTYFWPLLAAGLVVGIVAGLIAFRRSAGGRNLALALGGLAVLALAGLWHGPLGAADQYSARVERALADVMVRYEIPQVSGQLQRGPLKRQVLLSGNADEFQRRELVRLVEQIPGVSSASWSPRGGLPLIAEAGLAALLGFLLGLLLAYLVELRRRYNAQWNW